MDFQCARLPLTTRYKQHEHPFTLNYAVEHDSSDYYCDIREEERDPKHWFYYCADCSYPVHPKCILAKYPNIKFGGDYTFDCYPHPFTIIEKTKDHPKCHECGYPCKEFFFQCAMCNLSVHANCLWKDKCNFWYEKFVKWERSSYYAIFGPHNFHFVLHLVHIIFNAIFEFIKVVLLTHIVSKLFVMTTSSTLLILLLKSINLFPKFVNFVFKK